MSATSTEGGDNQDDDQENLGENAPSDRISVVSQGYKIRAIVCGEGRDAEVRSKLEALCMSTIGYDSGVTSSDAIQQ